MKKTKLVYGINNFNLYILLNNGLQYLFVCTYLNSNLMNMKLSFLS